MSDLKDYYTHKQAERITGERTQYILSLARQSGVSTIQYGNKHLYHRTELQFFTLGRIIGIKDATRRSRAYANFLWIVEETPAISADLNNYISRSDALKLWPWTHEWFYKNTTKRGAGKPIDAIQIGNFYLFNKQDILSFVSERNS